VALHRRPEEGLTMLITLLWGAGAVVIGVYMLVALIRPERF
jgi:K+-transporting ATPase KdpF subunit